MSKKSKNLEPVVVTTTVKVLPGQKCLALNYRCKPAVWETGECTHVEIGVNHRGKPNVQYTVILDRRSLSKRDKYRQAAGHDVYGTVLRLYVGQDKIERQ